MLTGLQPGYTKFFCFLRLWDSRARIKHYVCKHWPARDEIEQGKQNTSKHHFCKVIESINHFCILNLVCLSNL